VSTREGYGVIGNIDATSVSIGAVYAPSPVPRTVTEPGVLTSYGKRISAARKKKGLDQADLAKAAKVHVKTVSRWENDRQRPERDQEDALVEVLDVTREWLRGQEQRRATGLAMVRETPRVALGIPQRIRIWLQEFLLELVTAGVSEDDVDRVRRILSSDEMYRYYAGGEPKEYSEDETLEGIQAHAEAFRREFRRRGYKIPK
jgi:transcriptional regulator with XRE-family HTH domain